METCKNCGMPLDDPDQELCAACRAEKAAAAHDRRVKRAGHARRRRMNPTTRTLLILVCILAVIFIALSTTATLMYKKYSPERFISSVETALADGNIKSLKPMLKGTDLTVSDEGAAALCRAFAGEDARSALREQLQTQVVDAKAQGDFPALGIAKEKVFFGYSRYFLTVHSVRLLLNAPVQNPRLSLDNLPYSGVQTADGLLYENLFPGAYACTVSGSTASGQAVNGISTELSLFSFDTPTVFTGELPIATVTVSGCTDDSAVITLDGTVVEQRPSGGTVTLPNIAVGSRIGMSYTAPWGAVTTASVEFTDLASTALTFENHVTEGGAPSAEQIGQMISAHYASYLDAVNNQNTALILGCTEDYKNSIADSVTSEEMKKNLYVMGHAECNASAIKLTAENGSARVSCYVMLDYTKTDRETNEEETVTLYKTYTFQWVGAWAVNGSTDSTVDAYLAADASLLP